MGAIHGERIVMAYKLMIVDDERANLRLLERLFASDYKCLTASSGSEAIQLLQQHVVAVLITDQRMPEMTGIELLKQTADLRPHMVRILLTGYTDVEALVEAINSGLVYMYVTKPWNNSDLKVRIGRALEHYENNKKRHALALANERLILRLEEMELSFISVLAEALRAKDEFAYHHAIRVRNFALEIGKTLGLSAEEQRELSSAAVLHNVGHIGTPDRILCKTQQLTEEEQSIFEAHSERGAIMMSRIKELRELADTIRFHHENFDGTGYPRGLRGEQIPLACRIIRVADEYDLLTQPRDTALASDQKTALETLIARSGKDFDPRIIDVLIEQGNEIMLEASTSQPAFHYA
jgi:putative two-component system response regulator